MSYYVRAPFFFPCQYPYLLRHSSQQKCCPNIPSYANEIIYSYPIRRLIITGQDTPENFATLLGSNWQDVSNVVIEKPSLGPNQQLIFDFITEMRLIILMSDTEGILPPIDSPTYKLAQALDEGRNGWTPRPSTNKEHQATGDMMEIVEAIEKVFGSDLHDQIWLTAAELSEFFRRKGIMIPNGDSMEWFVVALHVTGRDWRLESVIGPVLLRRRSE